MRRRHHYATTGNRMILDVTAELPVAAELFIRDPGLGPAPSSSERVLLMGDIARTAADEVTLAVNAVGSAPIERLDIFDGFDLIETIRPYALDDLGSRVRLIYEGAEYRGRARTTTWDGSLQLSGNAIRESRMINNWNLDRGIQEQDETRADLEGGHDWQLWCNRYLAYGQSCRPPRVSDDARFRGGGDRGPRHRGASVRGRRP